MTMIATVIRTEPGNILVWDAAASREVKVHFRDAGRFSPGERIRITYNGAMTHSIPPQITAISIQRIESPAKPAEMRAVILERRRNLLVVRDTSNNMRVHIHFPHANHFCVGQRVVVRHDTITMSNPPQVTAIDITPVC